MKRNSHGCKVLVHSGLPIVPATLSCFSLVQEPSDGSLSSSCPVTRVQSWAIWLAGFLECGAQQEMEPCLGDRRASVRPGLKEDSLTFIPRSGDKCDTMLLSPARLGSEFLPLSFEGAFPD